MCYLYSITTNQEAIRALFRVVNRYVGNLAPMPGVFPDYPRPGHSQFGQRTRVSHDALGHATSPQDRRAAGDQYPQHILAALAGLAKAWKPLPRAV